MTVPYVTAEVFTRVVRFAGERGRPGTAFVAEVEGRSVLVTAKHLCVDESAEQVTLQHAWTEGGKPFPVVLERLGDRQRTPDVAVFAYPDGLLHNLVDPMPVNDQGIVYTQDVYILGYPLGMSFRLTPEHSGALTKRGILCGQVAFTAGESPLFIIDAFANPGFSGGPMAFRQMDTGAWNIGGVVAHNIAGPAREPTSEEPNPPHVASGLSVVVPAGKVADLVG